MTLLEQIN